MQDTIGASASALSRWECEWRATSRDGTVRWLRGTGTPRRTPDGGVLWNTLIVDITEQRAAQAALVATLRSTIGLLNAAVEARDPYTAGHQSRVGRLATHIARSTLTTTPAQPPRWHGWTRTSGSGLARVVPREMCGGDRASWVMLASPARRASARSSR